MTNRIANEPEDGFPELIRNLASSSRQLMNRYHHELTDKFGPVEGELYMYDIYIAGALRRS